jgi:hypothetical protein
MSDFSTADFGVPASLVEGLLPWMQGPDRWEDLANQLLLQYHGIGSYQPMPSRHRGDWGIDGFAAHAGHVYQFYACQEPVTVDQRYQNQRAKLRADTEKFIDNKKSLAVLFAAGSVKCWMLLVPTHDSSQLVAYAVERAGEVRNANLPYTHPEFTISILSLVNFSVQLAQYLTASRAGLKLPSAEVSDEQLREFLSSESEFIANLRRKLSAITGKQDDALASLIGTFVRHHLISEDLLDTLKRDSNETWNNIMRCREMFEQELAYHTGECNMQQHLETLREHIRTQAGLAQPDSSTLARGAVSLFLGNCSLEA